jgi:enamine deaminase RidA (YjgF/YER057c/UK114 family)
VYDRSMADERTRSGSPYEELYGFSRGVRHGNRVEIAGTAPVPPEGLPVAGTAYEQMLRCGEIVAAALSMLGASPADVVRTRMYITDAGDADEIGRAHRELFGEAAPVATMVVVAALLDPAWKVEIEVEAEVGD